MLKTVHQTARAYNSSASGAPNRLAGHLHGASIGLFLAGAILGTIYGIIPVLFFSTLAEVACTPAKVRSRACA